MRSPMILMSLFLVHALATTPAWADWRKELGTFRVGMVEAQAKDYSPEDMDRLKNLMSSAIGIPVEIFRARDFPSLIDAHVSSRIEYAIYSSAAYATAWLACQCVEPLAAPVNADGTSGYKAVVFANPAVDISSLPESRGMSIPGRDSLIGFGAPLASFAVSGSPLTGKEAWLTFATSQGGGIKAYAEGNADAFVVTAPAAFRSATSFDGLAWISAFEGKAEKPVPLWESAPIPFGPHAVRRNLAPEAKDSLSALLTRLPQADAELAELLLPDESVGFKPVEHGDYSLAVNAAKALAAVSGNPAQ